MIHIQNIGINILDQAHYFFVLIIYGIANIMILNHSIRSIDRWTFISREIVERINRIDVFKTQIKELKIILKDYFDDILLIAADIPQLLPTDDKNPDSYLKIDALTRPICNGNCRSIENDCNESIGY